MEQYNRQPEHSTYNRQPEYGTYNRQPDKGSQPQKGKYTNRSNKRSGEERATFTPQPAQPQWPKSQYRPSPKPHPSMKTRKPQKWDYFDEYDENDALDLDLDVSPRYARDEMHDEARDEARAPRQYEPTAREANEGVDNILCGRNPIREALKSGRDIEKILVAKGDLSGSMREIIALAKEKHVVIQEVDRRRLTELAPQHQGIVALTSAYEYATIEAIFARAKEREEPPFVIVLDGVTDPHNLGAIIRSAEVAGAHGVIVPERRAVGLTPAAVKASAGAVEYVPVARVGNIVRCLELLKAEGLWVYGSAVVGDDYTGTDFTGPLAIVIGAEDTGISRLAQTVCDASIAIPVRGNIGSLNASVAAGVLMYEVVRQRGGK